MEYKYANIMCFMFYNCSSLITFPDISIWNINAATDIRGISDIIGITDGDDDPLENYLNYFRNKGN